MSVYEEIDLKDVICRILFKWKLIISCGILLAICMGGYKLYNNQEYNKRLQNDNVQGLVNEISLTEQEKHIVEIAMETYDQLNTLLEIQQNTLYGKLNSYRLKVSSITYYVEISNEGQMGIYNELKDAYIMRVNNYIDTDNSENFLVWSELKNEKNYVYMEDSGTNKFIFTVNLVGADDEHTMLLADKVKEELNDFQKVLNEKICAHKLVVLDEKTGFVNNETMAYNQYNLISRINTLQTYLANTTAKFSQEQQQVYNQMIAKIDASEDVVEDVVSSPVTLTAGVVKYGFVGMFFGFFLACMGIMAFYVLSNKLKTSRTFTLKYSIDLIETFEGLNSEIEKKKLFVVDRKIQGLKNKGGYTLDVKKSILCSNIVNMCNQRDIAELCIVSTLGLSGEEKEFVMSVVEQLKKVNITLTICDNVLKDMDSFEQLSKIKQVVLLEKTAVSKNDSIEQLLNVCKLQNANILGGIVL